jgi:hypothetical protein
MSQTRPVMPIRSAARDIHRGLSNIARSLWPSASWAYVIA